MSDELPEGYEHMLNSLADELARTDPEWVKETSEALRRFQANMAKQKPWNRCDVCGKFIAHREFEIGMATRQLVSEDTAFSGERYGTICGECRVYDD